MLGKMQLLIDYVVSPGSAAGEIKSSRSGLFTFLVFAASILAQTLAAQILALPSGGTSIGIFSVDAVSGFSAGCVALFLFTLWVHFMADIMNRISGVKSIMKILCVSSAPLLLCLPLSLLLAAITNKPAPFYYIFYFFILLKIISLVFVGIRESCYLSSGETVLLFAAPIVIVPAVFALILVLGLIYVLTVFM
jgi:hypothetical protein